MRLLAVDDEEDSRISLKLILESGGHQVELATNGREAINTLNHGQFDLVITDLLMPDMDGFELCRLMKLDPELRSIPIIFHSATYVDKKDMALARELGVSRYLLKPTETTELLEAIDKSVSEPAPQPAIAQDEQLRIVNKHRDILARKLEKKVLELEKEHQALLEQTRTNAIILNSTGEGIFGLNKEATITFVNPAAASKLGYSEGELLGSQSHKLLHFRRHDGTEYPQEECPIYEALQSGTIVSGEEHFICKDDSDFPATFISHPILENGLINGAVVSFIDITQQKQAEARTRESQQKLKRALEQTIEAIVATLEKRDPYTAGHQRRVADLTVEISRELGLDEAFIKGIKMGATIHDIGKIHIPSEILNRTGPLSPAEFAVIKTHPEHGYEIVKDIDFPWPVADVVYQHHERWNGSGYPQGLAGEEISFAARIMAVADVVEAMSGHRPYRPALGIEAALYEVERGSGTLFDPQIASACLRLFREKGFQLGTE
ncbi:MAG: response regulator [Candidatus Thiodiazotropha sp. (ex. Lucinisca nassula)]|nr:response regulator [Candidatus Thiodiazotropha sp. (ex. Lucinisca nassula)]MBW9268707.1 response regulator [Candidatus Thiodiazotropha sp. (ex. Lucinisca nassula)]